jgi:tryptophan synthase alpha subunit
LDTVVRRLELLKLEGLGFSQAEIVNELSQKAACTKRAVYKDFETRESWQPALQSVVEPKAVLLKVVNRYEQIYRQASIRLLTFENELAQLGALNTMLKANSLLFESAVLPEVLGRLRDLEDKAKRGVFVP